MNKKTKKQIMKYVDLGIVGLAVLALIMIFLPAFVLGDEGVNGIKAVFGYKESIGVFESTIYKFSFMNFLTYLLVLATAVCAALSFLQKNKKFLLIAILLAAVAGVLFLLTKSFVVLPSEEEVAYEWFKEIASLGAGPIIGSICMFLAAIAGAGKVLLDK